MKKEGFVVPQEGASPEAVRNAYLPYGISPENLNV